jgi:hypothetical protein
VCLETAVLLRSIMDSEDVLNARTMIIYTDEILLAEIFQGIEPVQLRVMLFKCCIALQWIRRTNEELPAHLKVPLARLFDNSAVISLEEFCRFLGFKCVPGA